MAEWAHGQGFAYVADGKADDSVVTGTLAGKPFKLERGRASRDYIRGDELRARAEL